MTLFSRLLGPSVEQINTDQMKSRLKEKRAPLLLDVRQPEEYFSGHINGAKLIPLSELSQRIAELPRNREIICVCRSGNRSNVAARKLVSAGFNALNLQGGMIAWGRAGNPIKRGFGK
jgi:rhodanese-related sulfurtransferase